MASSCKNNLAVPLMLTGIRLMPDRVRSTGFASPKLAGQDGLVDSLDHMMGTGHFSAPYGVGNDIKYIIQLPPDKGRWHIRLVTDRRISFREVYASTRSEEYSLRAVDLCLTTDGKGSEGMTLPACKLTVDKKTKQIDIETYQNPWNLINLIISKQWYTLTETKGQPYFAEGEAQAQSRQFSSRKFGYGNGRRIFLVQHQPDCTV